MEELGRGGAIGKTSNVSIKFKVFEPEEYDDVSRRKTGDDLLSSEISHDTFYGETLRDSTGKELDAIGKYPLMNE